MSKDNVGSNPTRPANFTKTEEIDMTTHAIARLEADRDSLKNNIKVRNQIIKNLKAELLEELQHQIARRETLKEVEEAISKLKGE